MYFKEKLERSRRDHQVYRGASSCLTQGWPCAYVSALQGAQYVCRQLNLVPTGFRLLDPFVGKGAFLTASCKTEAPQDWQVISENDYARD